MKQRKVKIFIGLQEFAGYFGSLNDGFHELGIYSCFFQYYNNKYYHAGTWFMRCCQYVSQKRSADKTSNWFFLALDCFLRLIVLCWAVSRYNVFIFSSVSTFFKYKELWILKKMGKKIIYVFVGSESRPDYLSGNIVNNLYSKDGEIINIEDCIKHVELKKKRIQCIEKYADYCINHPPCAFFHQKSYIKWLYIGFPFSKTITNIQYYSSNVNVKIVHAPSNPQTKGTEIIREIINHLKNEGLKIEYIELIDQPNSKVLELLSQCDFVIDELYSDIPLGGLGTEAAFLGKPTINGGYYCKYIEQDYDKTVIPPAVFCGPQEIEEKIRLLISDIEFRQKSGKDAYEFVINNWAAKVIATKYLSIINDDIPSEWIGNPYNLNYLYGYGQSKEQLKMVIDAMLNRGGKDCLALSDKPDLLNILLK